MDSITFLVNFFLFILILKEKLSLGMFHWMSSAFSADTSPRKSENLNFLLFSVMDTNSFLLFDVNLVTLRTPFLGTLMTLFISVAKFSQKFLLY